MYDNENDTVERGQGRAQAFHDGLDAGLQAGQDVLLKLVCERVKAQMQALDPDSPAHTELAKLHGWLEIQSFEPEETLVY